VLGDLRRDPVYWYVMGTERRIVSVDRLYSGGRVSALVASRLASHNGARSSLCHSLAGLTASLGIGRHVVYLLQQCVLPAVDPPPKAHTTPLPPLDKLLRDYRARNDGSVRITGHVYRVTHPLTKFGWDGTDSKNTGHQTTGTLDVADVLVDNP